MLNPGKLVRVDFFTQRCALEVGLEGLVDLILVVNEIQHEGSRLARGDTVEARERLHSLHA